MDGHDILVSLGHGHRTAAVVRYEDGRLFLIGDLGGGGSGLQDYRPSVTGVFDEDGQRTVQGGRLPPTAVAAEVVDDSGARRQAAVGKGAWVIVLDQPTTGSTNPVRFTDSRGQTVAPPLPDDWPRSPVEDAEEPCPACGACAWEQVHPLDGSRGMSGGGGGFLEEPLSIFGGPPPPVDLQPTPFVVCRICGHEESNGGFVVMAVAPVAAVEDEHPEELARRVREQEEAARSARKYMEAHRRQMREALSQLDFPIYAAEGEPARLLGSGSSSGSGVSSVIVGQEASNAESGPMVRVETASRGEWPENETALARRALEHLLAGEAGAWPHRSEAGMAIWLHTRERECRRRVALATVGERQFLVEGRPEQFAFSTVTDRWAAVRCTERILITITASGVTPDSVTLRQIRDPARELFESSVD